MKKRRTLHGERLESRQLMAADVSFSGGVLKVEMDPNSPRKLEIEPQGQYYVRVVGNGTDLRDQLDLSDVEPNRFTSLRETVINGHGRRDVIIGSGVRDRIDGGRGNDHLDGQEGNDIIQGGSGHDTLYGGLGRDVLRGGSGNDWMWGNARSSKDKEVDFIFGGSGYDSFDRTGPTDWVRGVENFF